jgi:hypothetical protein
MNDNSKTHNPELDLKGTKNSEHSPSNSEETLSTEYKPTDFSKFALSQNFGAQIKVTMRLTTVPVRKPSKTQWFRSHPKYKLDALLLKYGDSGEDYYLVEPSLAHQVEELAQAFRLVVGVDRQGVIFVWPLRLPDAGRAMNWHLSALEAASHAEIQWTRIHAHMSLGAYEIYAAEGITDEPKWPEMSMNELLEIAFKNKIIDRDNHFVLQQLRGEA